MRVLWLSTPLLDGQYHTMWVYDVSTMFLRVLGHRIV